VARDVGEPFLQRPEERQVRVVGEGGQPRRQRERHGEPAALLEVGAQRAQRRHQPQIVEQRGAQLVGHVADAPDPGVDEREHPVEALAHPLGRERRPAARRAPHALAQHPELHLHRREHLRRLVVQLAREPPALLLVLAHHAQRQPLELRAPPLERAVERRRVERGAHLLPQRLQEVLVERGERVARVAGQQQHRGGQHRRRRPLGQHRERRHRGVPGEPLCDLGAPARRHRGQQRGQRAIGARALPRRARAGPAHAHERAVGPAVRRTAAAVDRRRVGGEERGPAHRRQRQRAHEQRVERVALPRAALQVARERAQRRQPAPQVVHDQQHDPEPHGQLEADVEVVAPRRPRPPRAQQRIVEVVHPPERERHRQHERPRGADLPVIAPERQPRPGGRQRQEGDHRRGGQQEGVEPVDRHERPDHREGGERQVAPPPGELPREDERGPQQDERDEPGDDLVRVEPDAPLGDEEAADRAEPHDVERPRCGEPGEVRLAVPPVEEQAQERERRRDRALQHGGGELGARDVGDLPVHARS
jgi:hypothetical protein